MTLRIRFVPRDLWVGVYVGEVEYGIGSRGQFRRRSIYVCIVPCLPIVITRTEAR